MRGVVFTFDDDVSSHYDVVATTFEKYGLTATFFINGSQLNMWKTVVDYNNVCYELSDMSDAQLVGLYQCGFEIGNHTINHIRIGGGLQKVLAAFDATVEKLGELGIPQPSTVCYPGFQIPGDALVQSLQAAGYKLGRVGYSNKKLVGKRRDNCPQEWERGPDNYYTPGECHPLRVTTCGSFCDNFTFELFEKAINECPDEAYCVFTGHVFTLDYQVEKLERVCEFCRENDLNVIQFKDLPTQ